VISFVDLYPPYMHSRVGVQMLKLLDGFFCEHVFLVDPLVLCIQIPLPLDEVLQFAPLSETPRGHDSLHFVFFFPIDKVRWWLIVVCAVEPCFVIRGQEVYVKHGV
jgi:hypothetical protein